jgi:hypothetical protein
MFEGVLKTTTPNFFSEPEKARRTKRTPGSIRSHPRCPIISAAMDKPRMSSWVTYYRSTWSTPSKPQSVPSSLSQHEPHTTSGLVRSQVWTTGGLAGHAEKNSSCPRESHASQTTIPTEAAATLSISWWSPGICSLCTSVHAATTHAQVPWAAMAGGWHHDS